MFVLGAVLLVLCAAVCMIIAADGGVFSFSVGTDNTLWVIVTLAGLIALSVLIVVPHELIHALCFPAKLSSDKVIIGSYLKMGAFYAFYDGEISKRRYLVIFLAPLIVLSGIPLTLLLCGVRSIWLYWLFLVHTPACAGDLMYVALMLFRVPKGAVVRNKGYKTYFRLTV
jgi:hypothetical protein